MLALDISPLTPEARRVVQAAAPVYLRHAGPDFVGLRQPSNSGRQLIQPWRPWTRLPAFVTGSLLEHGGGRLPATVRLLCTKVWPALYNMLTLRHEDVFAVWRLPKERAIELVPVNIPPGSTLRAFYNVVHAYYPAEASIEQALAVIEHGVAVLQTARHCYEETYSRAQ